MGKDWDRRVSDYDTPETVADGPVFVERIDYEAAVAYLEAHLPEDVRPYADRMETETIDAALVGVREATEEQGEDVALGIWFPIRRFVTDWEEVEQ